MKGNFLNKTKKVTSLLLAVVMIAGGTAAWASPQPQMPPQQNNQPQHVQPMPQQPGRQPQQNNRPGQQGFQNQGRQPQPQMQQPQPPKPQQSPQMHQQPNDPPRPRGHNNDSDSGKSLAAGVVIGAVLSTVINNASK